MLDLTAFSQALVTYYIISESTAFEPLVILTLQCFTTSF